MAWHCSRPGTRLPKPGPCMPWSRAGLPHLLPRYCAQGCCACRHACVHAHVSVFLCKAKVLEHVSSPAHVTHASVFHTQTDTQGYDTMSAPRSAITASLGFCCRPLMAVHVQPDRQYVPQGVHLCWLLAKLTNCWTCSTHHLMQSVFGCPPYVTDIICLL